MNIQRMTLSLSILLTCGMARAEWYRVDSVPAYNTIRAVKADSDKEPVVIRIRNLDKIEYLQPKSEKVLMGGSEAISLAKSVLQGQLVWVENIQVEEGAYVADIYPSFEQIITVYKKKRMVNGDNISEGTKEKLKVIYKQMLAEFNLTPLLPTSDAQAQQVSKEIRSTLRTIYTRTLSNLRTETPNIGGGKKKEEEAGGAAAKQYDGRFQRALFTADAITWFREKGQYMHPLAQQLFIELLKSFQSDADSEARYTQVRIKEIMKRDPFFKELFLNAADFERGKFTYECLEWFKTTGQYLPEDVQNLFVNWLRTYQQTHSNDGDFIKQRLQWMLKNHGLYQDFLELGD